MDVEALREQWAAQGARAPVHPAMTFDGAGVVLGAGTRIAGGDAADSDDRAIALLSAAYGRPVDQSALRHVRHALDKRGEGDQPIALIHLAMTGLGKLERPQEDAQRLFMADGLMRAGVAPEIILDALELGGSKNATLDRAYNPDQPRVPAGSGRESGQWAGENAAGSESPDGATAESRRAIQVADASSNWAQYLNPVGSAEAAEARNGTAPNIQHDSGVERAMADYQRNGFEIAVAGATYVDITGFSSPRVYDFIARDPVSGNYIGVEVKTTFYDTINLSPSQVEKDVAIYTAGGGYSSSLRRQITQVAYEAFCANCSFLNVRSWYLAARLANAGIKVTAHSYPGGHGAPF